MKIQPEKQNLEETEKIIRETVEKSSTVLGVNTEPDVALGFTHKPFTKNTLGGVSGETFEDGKVDIRFNSEVDGWKENLRRTMAHEYAHTHFFQIKPRNSNDELWKVILGEAQATNLAEKCFPNAEPPTISAVTQEELREYWSKVKNLMEEEMGWNNRVFFSDFYNSEIPMYYGYSLAFRIGRELLKEYCLEEFADLGKVDVINTGDGLFK